MTANSDFASLLETHAGLLSRIASSYESDPALRDDLLQDIALALWRALPGWRGDASMKTFVARVAHNRGASHVVGRTRQPASVELDERIIDNAITGPEDQARINQDRSRLQRAVHALPIGLRQAVSLALEGFDHKDIADVLGITVNNVDVRLHRARVVLKSALGEHA